MKFNELSDMMQKPEPKPDTYEAGMALNQLLKIGTHAIKIHNMIDDDAEMEAWVAKKIDLASNYVKSVHGYTAGSKAGTYDDNGMTEGDKQQASDKEIKMAKGVAFDKRYKDGNYSGAYKTINKIKPGLSDHPDVADALKRANEDAGEGHMSKSQLYQTAKMSIELLDMIRKGDDLEGWVQTKLNLAADYLQAVYHYEDYQKLNPYREELDSSLMQRHAGIIQKHLDEILERKCRAEDVDTKPGMMRILAKRVNEVEKEIAKENRKKTNEGSTLEEGIKDWARNLAMAGVIVAGLAGVGSIQDAIDRSVPAVQAMEKALEMAQDQGNDELAKMIKGDLSAVKVRLSSGKDLNFIKGMQDKYAKFIQTEGLTFEARLAVRLESKLR